MRGLPSILSLVLYEFNKFNYAGARMLDSIDHMNLKILKNRIFDVKTPSLSLLLQYYNGRHYVTSLNRLRAKKGPAPPPPPPREFCRHILS